jgi:hypothetical protein
MEKLINNVFATIKILSEYFSEFSALDADDYQIFMHTQKTKNTIEITNLDHGLRTNYMGRIEFNYYIKQSKKHCINIYEKEYIKLDDAERAKLLILALLPLEKSKKRELFEQYLSFIYETVKQHIEDEKYAHEFNNKTLSSVPESKKTVFRVLLN